MSTLLEVKDITKIYPNQPKPGLDHVSFEVMQGEFLGIMGASGSGKTTLLNVLSTIDIPTSGSIRMGGKKIQELSQTQAADFRKNNLGFIFQEYFLLDSLTVQENITVPLTLLHESAKTIDKKVMELAELFGIASQLKKYPSELSGGQRQRVAAARAMVKRPPLIFADEPTGALDSSSATELLFALSEVNQALGTTILMVTHDPYAANPVIADLFHRMKYMERRGSGLRKIVSETEKLPGYTAAYKPEFSSTATDFRVILKNVNYNLEDDTHQVIHQVTHQDIELSTVSKQILAFCTTPKSKKELAVFCGFKDLRNFTLKHINPLLESGQLEMTIPDKPKSRNQKYITVRSE